MAESREQGGGSSGRRSGVERRPRVRGRSLALRELIRRVGDELIEAESVGEPSATTEALLSRRERVVRRLWESALRGDLPAIRLLVEYTEGKPPGGAGSGETAKAGRAVTPFSADELAAAMSEVGAWRAAVEADLRVDGVDDVDGVRLRPNGGLPLQAQAPVDEVLKGTFGLDGVDPVVDLRVDALGRAALEADYEEQANAEQ